MEGQRAWYFQVYGFCIYHRLSPETYKIVSSKKEFEDLKDLLVSFGLYFVIFEASLCISIMYYLLLWIYVVLIVKKKLQKYPILNRISNTAQIITYTKAEAYSLFLGMPHHVSTIHNAHEQCLFLS
jgi:hypothetical protein